MMRRRKKPKPQPVNKEYKPIIDWSKSYTEGQLAALAKARAVWEDQEDEGEEADE